MLIHDQDLTFIRNVTLAFAQARRPTLVLADVVGTKKPDGKMHTLRCFPEDKVDLMKIADSTWRNPEFEAFMQAKLAETEAELKRPVDADLTPLPEWKP